MPKCEIEDCSECTNVKEESWDENWYDDPFSGAYHTVYEYKCKLLGKKIEDPWGRGIPKWCPLEEKNSKVYKSIKSVNRDIDKLEREKKVLLKRMGIK